MHRIISLLLGLSCFAHAATEEVPSKKPARSCRILFFSPEAGAPEKAFLNDGTADQEVALPSMNLSDVYALPAGDLILRLLPQKAVAGQPLPAGAPAIALPETVQDCYLLITSDPTNTVLPLRMQMVNADSGKFHAGQMMWFNLSPYTVGGTLGKSTVNLKPNSRAIVDPPAAGSEYYPVKLGYLPVVGESAEPLSSTLWRHTPTARSVVFVFVGSNNQLPQFKSFLDSRFVQKTE